MIILKVLVGIMIVTNAQVKNQDSIMISENYDKYTSLSGNINNNDISSSRNSNNNVHDVIEKIIDNAENDNYNKNKHDPPASLHIIDTNL